MSEKDVREFLFARIRDNQAREIAQDDIIVQDRPDRDDRDTVIRDNVVRASRRFETDDLPPSAARLEQQKDERVLALLNQIGERLIRSERERQALAETVSRYSGLIGTLENKIDRQALAEESIRQRQEKLERDYAAHMEKMQKAILLAERIEEAITQQNRLARRIEQITQDRAHMLRKLERIEEAVIETQGVLNTQSLVVAGEGNRAVDNPASRTARPANQNMWQTPVARQVASTAAAILLIAGLSWGLYNAIPALSPAPETLTATTENLLAPTSFDPRTVPDVRDLAVNNDPGTGNIPIPEDLLATAPTMPDEGIFPDSGLMPPVTVPVNPVDDTPAQDITAKSDDELVAILNNDPDALASALNNIAPGAAGLPQVMNDIPLAVEEPVAVRPTANTENNDNAVSDFIQAQVKTRPLKERIQPDLSLSPEIKAIEDRAFEGVPEAQHDLAAIYTAGHDGVKTDFARAAAWFEESAVNGIANARYNLGVLYHQGLGVTRDVDKAMNWYKAAAAQNHPEAQYNLGIAYIEGAGTEYSPQRAALNFESAARAGIMEASYNLGLIHENGLLGTPDIESAVYWYRRAAEEGSPEGKAALNQLAKNMGYSESKIESIYRKQQEILGAPATSATASTPPVSITPAAAIRTPAEPIPVLPLDEFSPDTPVPQLVPASQKGAARVSTKDAAVIAQIQEQLINYGLYPGPADGRYDDVMADSIRSYQKSHDLPADGRASEALLVHMLAQEMGSQQ